MGSYELELERGIMRDIAANIPGTGHDLDAPWDDDALPTWPIFPRVEPTPDKLIAVVVGMPLYERADVETLVQLRVRGAADEAESVVLEMWQLLHDLYYPRGFPRVHFWLPEGPRIGATIPVSRGRLGQDSQRRYDVSMNLRFRGRRVATGC